MSVVTSAFLVLILIAAFVVLPPLAFRYEPKFRDEYSLMFSPDGIHFHTAHIDSNLAWNLYSRALVDAHSYVLYYGSRTFTVIPKRVFQNTEQQAAFDQLLDPARSSDCQKKVILCLRSVPDDHVTKQGSSLGDFE